MPLSHLQISKESTLQEEVRGNVSAAKSVLVNKDACNIFSVHVPTNSPSSKKCRKFSYAPTGTDKSGVYYHHIGHRRKQLALYSGQTADAYINRVSGLRDHPILKWSIVGSFINLVR